MKILKAIKRAEYRTARAIRTVDSLRAGLVAQNKMLDEYIADLDVQMAALQAARDEARQAQRLNDKFIESAESFLHDN